MPATKPQWTQRISDCLSEFVREQGGSLHAVVDYEFRVDAATAPDDILVWFICRSKTEKEEFLSMARSRSISLFKKRMLAAGFPESAVASVEVRVTSREERERAGSAAGFSR